jgi:hypothetical protein
MLLAELSTVRFLAENNVHVLHSLDPLSMLRWMDSWFPSQMTTSCTFFALEPQRTNEDFRWHLPGGRYYTHRGKEKRNNKDNLRKVELTMFTLICVLDRLSSLAIMMTRSGAERTERTGYYKRRAQRTVPAHCSMFWCYQTSVKEHVLVHLRSMRGNYPPYTEFYDSSSSVSFVKVP